MTREKSCGAVVFTKIDDDIKYLLVKNLDGIYGFLKGHMENGETEAEPALREAFEETNVKIKLTIFLLLILPDMQIRKSRRFQFRLG